MKIAEVNSSLVSVYDDWADILVNPQFVRKRHSIVWPSFPPPFHDEFPLRSFVIGLAADKHFTFQVVDDGALIQLSYHFKPDDVELARATLVFFGSTDLMIEPDTPELTVPPVASSAPGYRVSENPTADPPAPWLRIDYEPTSQRGPLHPLCHLHLPFFPHARIALTAIPSPRQFIEFLMSACYPHHYKAKRLDGDDQPQDLAHCRGLNNPSFPHIPEPVQQILLHLQIP